MALKIRLARRGSKKRPFYHIVVADSRMPRDGRYLEKIGTYNPLLAKDNAERVQIDLEKVKTWQEKGAKPTDRVARFLEAADAMAKTERNNPKKAVPGKKMADRAEEKAAKLAEANAPAEEAPAEEAPAEEAAVEDAPAEEASAE